MYRLIGVVISIGLADSLNPTTIAPALYLASGEGARQRVARFTAGVFFAYFLGGAVIALGPGELILALVPRPEHNVKHVLEIIAGVAMIGLSIVLWRRRERLSGQALPDPPASTTRHEALLGATITAVELPTAFPYFAAITTIVGSDLGPGRQLFLLVLFNVCFVLPLVGILAILWLAGDRATEILTNGRMFLHRHWPVLLSGVALLAGVFVTVMGITGVLVAGRGKVHTVARSIRRLLHLSTKP